MVYPRPQPPHPLYAIVRTNHTPSPTVPKNQLRDHFPPKILYFHNGDACARNEPVMRFAEKTCFYGNNGNTPKKDEKRSTGIL